MITKTDLKVLDALISGHMTAYYLAIPMHKSSIRSLFWFRTNSYKSFSKVFNNTEKINLSFNENFVINYNVVAKNAFIKF